MIIIQDYYYWTQATLCEIDDWFDSSVVVTIPFKEHINHLSEEWLRDYVKQSFKRAFEKRFEKQLDFVFDCIPKEEVKEELTDWQKTKIRVEEEFSPLFSQLKKVYELQKELEQATNALRELRDEFSKDEEVVVSNWFLNYLKQKICKKHT